MENRQMCMEKRNRLTDVDELVVTRLVRVYVCV